MGVIFLTDYYYPKPMANGVCVHKLAKEYVRYGEQVYVICFRQTKDEKSDHLDTVKIIRIKMPFYLKWSIYHNDNTFLCKAVRVLGRSFGCFKKLIHLKNYPLRDTVIVKRFFKTASDIIETKNITTVVASCNPIESVVAGALLKEKYPDLHTVYYSLDTLSNERGYGILPESFRSKSGLRNEIKYFSVFDQVILMNCHKEHYSKDIFSEFRDKIEFADFPLFEPNIMSSKQFERSYQIVYTGYLHKVMRNPRPAIEILKPILDKYTLHFYIRGDCDDIIGEYVSKYRIVNHGFVAHNEAQSAIQKADVLLSIGNAETAMAPSKIYEYISTGKPIIHVYTYDIDPCLPILRKYGNALCIKAGDVNNNEKVMQFFEHIHPVPISVMKDVFLESTPAYTIGLILNKQDKKQKDKQKV